MAKRKKHILDAGVCRDIVRELIGEQGPLTVSQLHFQIRKVFRVNSAYMVTTLTSRDGGFIIDNGLVDIEFIRPVQSVGRKRKKR